jgi:hypothetical protein
MYLREYSPQPGYSGYYGALGQAPPPPLTAAARTAAVNANRRNARRIGWGCVVANVVRPIPQLRTFLGLAAGANEEALAQAIANWQRTNISAAAANGQLDAATWSRMKAATPPVIPATTFQAFSRPVTLGTATLGVVEKSMPLRRCFFNPTTGACSPTRTGVANELGGVQIELGFRVTDMAAVTAAGFVVGGEDNFRWIQVVDFISVPSATAATGFIRRHSKVIDPTTLVGAVPDPHPYYWDEVTPAGSSPAFLNANFVNRQASNRLCYDLIFEDAPRFPLRVATPGRRAYFNFELALVGVRPRNVAAGTPARNVILNTFLWGYDLVVEGGATNVRLNALRAGPFGGSPGFRRTLRDATNAGQFPNHCFVGAGFSGTSLCA